MNKLKLTSSNAHPSRDWLNPDNGYLHTPRARAKVAHWFKLQARDQNLEEGRQLVMRELDRLDLADEPLEAISEQMNKHSLDDMFAAVGAGDLRIGQIIHAVLQQADKRVEGATQQELPLLKRSTHDTPDPSGEIHIDGVGQLLTQLASCCHPVPGDDILGYVTLGRGVNVHRSDCDNLLHLMATEPERVLRVSWGSRPDKRYPVDMRILAYDRTGLLSDVSSLLANEKVNVVAVNTRSNPNDNTANMDIQVEVDSLERFGRVMNKIDQLQNVISVRRVRG